MLICDVLLPLLSWREREEGGSKTSHKSTTCSGPVHQTHPTPSMPLLFGIVTTTKVVPLFCGLIIILALTFGRGIIKRVMS
jgi:hypothetical protein